MHGGLAGLVREEGHDRVEDPDEGLERGVLFSGGHGRSPGGHGGVDRFLRPLFLGADGAAGQEYAKKHRKA